jgi:hypothetical protein
MQAYEKRILKPGEKDIAHGPIACTKELYREAGIKVCTTCCKGM